MRASLQFSALIVLLLAAASSLLELRGYLAARRFISFQEELQLENATDLELADYLELAARASAARGATAGSHQQLALARKAVADQNLEVEDRIGDYCDVLSALGRAVRAEPYRAEALMNWANMRQLLQGIDCRTSLTEGDFVSAARLAMESDPNNTSIQFAASLINLWGGNKEDALKLFGGVVEFDNRLTRGHEEYIIEQLSSAEDLLLVVPARFPQVARWSRIIKDYRPELLADLKPALVQLQMEALRAAGAEYRGRVVPANIHQERLLSLFELSADSEVRKLLDQELALFYSRGYEGELSDFFAERAQFESLDVVRSALQGDTRPERSVLGQWNLDQALNFDRFYATVGFYLPRGRSVQLIELVSNNPEGRIAVERVRVLVSGDNQIWHAPDKDVTVRPIQVANRSMVVIFAGGQDYRYWKIHYSSSQRNDKFGNTLDGMLHVYG